MFSDDAQPLSSRFDPPESRPPFRMTLVELLWREWFETMSQVAYQRKEPASFFVQNGSPTNGRFGPFDLRSSHSASEGPNDSIDMDKLKRCLQSMDSIQAARVMRAAQAMQTIEDMLKMQAIEDMLKMQAIEDMLKRQRSRANDDEGAAW